MAVGRVVIRWFPREEVNFLGLGLLFLIACPATSTFTGSQDAGLADASIDGGSPPQRLRLTVSYQLPDGGFTPLPFQAGARSKIDSTRNLELSTNIPITNYRVRVFDEADRVLVSDDRADESERGLDYRIVLAEPLKPGYRYALLLSAQAGSAILDAQGSPQEDQRIELQVVGNREKPIPEKRTKGSRRRRR